MTISEFVGFAKGCRTKAELSSLAKSNGLILSKDELNKLFQKVTEGGELNDDALEAAAGGTTYGITHAQIEEFLR